MGSRIENSMKLFSGIPSLPTADFETSKILEGNAYVIKYLWTDIANAASASLYIKSLQAFSDTPFIAVNFYVGGNYRVYSYCSPTITNDGIGIDAVNMNFTCGDNIISSDLFANPTVTNNGDSLGNSLIPGGDKKSMGGGSAYLYKAIMPSDTRILFIMTNVSGATADISLDATVFI